LAQMVKSFTLHMWNPTFNPPVLPRKNKQTKRIKVNKKQLIQILELNQDFQICVTKLLTQRK
jgi:hypothetical protein